MKGLKQFDTRDIDATDVSGVCFASLLKNY